MLRLELLRHAKSDWGDPSLGDRERPLNRRGRKAAVAMGEYLAAHALLPVRVLCSPATRARQTLRHLEEGCGPLAEIREVEELYAFGGFENIINVIRREGNSATPLLLVGHNPAFHDLALSLTGAGPAGLRALMQHKFPTAALAVLDFEIHDWTELQTGAGVLADFQRPRDL